MIKATFILYKENSPNAVLLSIPTTPVKSNETPIQIDDNKKTNIIKTITIDKTNGSDIIF